MAQETNAWAVGWSAFAGFMMVLLGFGWLMVGLIALADEAYFVVTPEYIFQFDVTTWGWVHLILGIIVLIAGFALFSGAVWARLVGVVVAVVATLTAFAWLPWYPIWAILLIGISIAIIWALTVHGDDLAAARGSVYTDG